MELYAEDYDAAGQTEKAAQISTVLLKDAKEIYLDTKPEAEHALSDEEMTAMEAEVAAISDEELERAVKG